MGQLYSPWKAIKCDRHLKKAAGNVSRNVVTEKKNPAKTKKLILTNQYIIVTMLRLRNQDKNTCVCVCVFKD